MPTLDWSQCPAVESVPGRLSGAWVFRNTRMPVSAVFENLEAGTIRSHVLNPILVRFFSKHSQTIYRADVGRCEGGVALVLPGSRTGGLDGTAACQSVRWTSQSTARGHSSF